ncbi:MAG: hypothetical protein K9K66_10795 [Desulfarculaceae bacterium]|nr:hypothetical protein [Desulfarculaceae bacterium]MCF8102135.1 hypothetical protein [Desulfarculaceae bacterium]MCF8118320.1 hypothetical protein [Desulfarculaceae bacterium]
MDKKAKTRERKPLPKWFKRMWLGIVIFIILVAALIAVVPKSDHITLVDQPRPMAEFRYEIKGAWNDADYLRQIRENFFETMRTITEDPKYKKVQAVKLAYLGKSLEGQEVTLAMFWVEMKEWRQVDPRLYTYDYSDQSERRQLGYLLRFRSIFNKQIARAFAKQARELAGKGD